MSLYTIPVTTLDGRPQTLEPYRGRVLLVVNVASKCGFTGQYAGLEQLHQQFHDKGLVVLGFPCDQFGHQEPGTDADIQQFCSTKYGVSFPMFSKVEVNGPDAHPLYQHLKAQKKGLLGTGAVKWNFTKFLVDRQGDVVARYSALTPPGRIARDVERLLGEPPG